MSDFYNMQDEQPTANFGDVELMDTVDAAIEASNEYDAQITGVGLILDDLTRTADMCLNMANVMQSTIGKGGVQPATVATANLMMQHGFQRYGVADTAVASMESAEAEGGAELVAGFGFEKATDGFKKAWDWALKQLKKLRQIVLKFWDRQFSILGRNGKAMKALATAAIDRKGSPEKSTVEPSKAQYITMGGKEVSSLSAEIDKLAGFVSGKIDSKSTVKGAEAAIKVYEDAANVSEPTSASIRTAIEEGFGLYAAGIDKAYPVKPGNDDRLKDVKGDKEVSDSLIGDIRFAVVTNNEAKTVSLRTLLPTEPKKAVKLKAMNQSDIASVCASGADLVAAILKLKDSQRDVERVYPSVEKAGKALQNALNDETKTAVKSEINRMINLVVGIERELNESRRAMVSGASSVAAGVLSYAKASYSNLKEAK